jgi:RNA polymerase sigma-70 factor (ECF subfamily)
MNGRRTILGDAIPDSTALLEAQIPGLRRFARVLLHADQERADDLVRECLQRALSRWPQRRRNGEDLRGWIYAILYSRFAGDQSRRRRYSRFNTSKEAVEAELPGGEGGPEPALGQRDLLRGFSKLPEDQRSVLFLIEVEDFSYAEASRILGVPIWTVMSRLSRGRERLRQHMSEIEPARTRSLLTIA